MAGVIWMTNDGTCTCEHIYIYIYIGVSYIPPMWPLYPLATTLLLFPIFLNWYSISIHIIVTACFTKIIYYFLILPSELKMHIVAWCVCHMLFYTCACLGTDLRIFVRLFPNVLNQHFLLVFLLDLLFLGVVENRSHMLSHFRKLHGAVATCRWMKYLLYFKSQMFLHLSFRSLFKLRFIFMGTDAACLWISRYIVLYIESAILYTTDLHV